MPEPAPGPAITPRRYCDINRLRVGDRIAHPRCDTPYGVPYGRVEEFTMLITRMDDSTVFYRDIFSDGTLSREREWKCMPARWHHRVVSQGEHIDSDPETPDLQPCPFCGSADVTIREPAADNPFVECRRCRGRGPEAGTRDWSAVLWNRRAPIAGLPAAAILESIGLSGLIEACPVDSAGMTAIGSAIAAGLEELSDHMEKDGTLDDRRGGGV